MSSSSNYSDSDASILDDESSMDRDECNNRKCRRLVALVSHYIFTKRNKRRKIPLPRVGKKKGGGDIVVAGGGGGGIVVTKNKFVVTNNKLTDARAKNRESCKRN
jgi:hypothetical protein